MKLFERWSYYIKQANKWTEDTAPKTLSDFPLLPNIFAEMLEKVVEADNTFISNNDSFIWLTNKTEIVKGKFR